MSKQQSKELSELQAEQLKIAQRNEAIADLLGFKRFLPGEEIKKIHEKQYPGSMKWYWIEDVGRYNSFELKFHNDWNWLISAAIEFKKYEDVDPPGSILWDLFNKIQFRRVIHLDMKDFWICLSDYALLLTKIKTKENKATPILNNSDKWYEILYPDKNTVVMDPDGWDRKNWQFSWYEELITEEEFNRRLQLSTCLKERNNI